MANNYVRFLRGTPTAYGALKQNGSISENTLYFISESGADTGQLYLGSKLIISSTSGVGSISDIADIITTDVTEGSILVYNADDEKWVAKTPAEVAAIIGVSVMVGATQDSDGTSGLVPVPKTGEQNLYLRGDATWADPVANLQTVLYGDADTEDSIRNIATEVLTNALTTSDESFDTLKEITDWIKNHPDEVATMNSDIAALEVKVTNLETVINGKDSTGVDDPGVIGLSTRITDLETAVSNLQADLDTDAIQSNIEAIDARLMWVDLNDDGSEAEN